MNDTLNVSCILRLDNDVISSSTTEPCLLLAADMYSFRIRRGTCTMAGLSGVDKHDWLVAHAEGSHMLVNRLIIQCFNQRPCTS